MKRSFYVIILILVAPMLAADVAIAQEAHYCVLRKAKLYAPSNCYEFYLADTWRRDAGLMAVTGLFGNCGVTDLAARQGWEVDPSYGGPYTQRQGTLVMNELSRYGGNFYGCQENPPQPDPQLDPQLAGWVGTWYITSYWEVPNTNSYETIMEVRVSNGGVTVTRGGNKIHNPRINGNTLTYRGNNGDHTHDVTFWRNGDTLTGRFIGSFNATGAPIRGTFKGYR